jgi:hypothetical protein
MSRTNNGHVVGNSDENKCKRTALRILRVSAALGLLMTMARNIDQAGAQSSRTTTDAINSAVQSAVESARDQAMRNARERASTPPDETRLRRSGRHPDLCWRDRP